MPGFLSKKTVKKPAGPRLLVLRLVIITAIVIMGAWLLWGNSRSVKVEKENPIPNSPLVASGTSPISGQQCDNWQRRPIAVLLSGDEHVRPLAGLSEADLVIEMPVVTDGVNRFMAVFICGDPREIGSVRSARSDFIPLAMGLDAILAHWGGSHFALDQLNNGVMDNIDALPNPNNVFFRKPGITAPDNGFTTMQRLIETAEKLGYRLTGKLQAYPHLATSTPAARSVGGVLRLGYPGQYRVGWEYDPQTNHYTRFRNNILEKDVLTGEPITAANVIVMKAASRVIESQYNKVDVEGEGEAIVYRNGEVISGVWRKPKKPRSSRLEFFKASGEPIKFMLGSVWIEIIEPEREVTWTEK